MENEIYNKTDANATEINDFSYYNPKLNHQIRKLIGIQIFFPQILYSTFTVFFLFFY